MPLKRSNAILDLSDPNLVLGPCKHRPTECLLENGDPLVCKKARNSSNKEAHTLLSMLPPTHPIHTMPNPGQATNHTESSDNKTAIVVEDSDETESDVGETTDEDDKAELGM